MHTDKSFIWSVLSMYTIHYYWKEIKQLQEHQKNNITFLEKRFSLMDSFPFFFFWWGDCFFNQITQITQNK